MAKRERSKGFRNRLLGLASGAAVLWAGFWGLVTYNVFTTNTGAGAVIGGLATVVAAALPAAMLYMRRKQVTPMERPPLEVPTSIRASYRRLVEAHAQVQGLVTEGVIDDNVLRGVDDRIDELMRLLSADVSNQQLGGQPSQRLREQVEQLTELLVGLADAALDQRTAALDSDNRAAAALREALGRMRAEEQGYRELNELEDGT